MQRYSESAILDSINNNMTKYLIFGIIFISILLYFQTVLVEASLAGSRPQYVYDRAGILNEKYSRLLDNYLRQLDDSTTAEIIVYTIPSFVGHGIKKDDGQEIQDRDTLANYIFNEAPLDGITGIGKKGKDNGILVLLSLSPDASGGSMRIEVGRGLEGNVTDGIAGEILDTYLVPAKESFIETKNITAINQGLLDTVVSLGKYIGYSSSDPQYNLTKDLQSQGDGGYFGILFLIIIILFVFLFGFRRRGMHWRRGSRGYWGGGWYGSSGGRWTGGGGSFGGFSGGGGSSGGGGAGR
jgi:uncharacterized protein